MEIYRKHIPGLAEEEFANKAEEGRPKRQEGRGCSVLESKGGDQEWQTNSV